MDSFCDLVHDIIACTVNQAFSNTLVLQTEIWEDENSKPRSKEVKTKHRIKILWRREERRQKSTEMYERLRGKAS